MTSKEWGKRHQSKPGADRRKAETRLARLERELRTDEARWRAVIDNPFMGITLLDADQRFVMANSTFQAMTGYSNDELKKLTPLDITPPAQREENRKVFVELQRGERAHFELIKQLIRKDGRPIWIQLYVFAVSDPGSADRHTVGMNFDITEKMQAQEALQMAQADLARAITASRMGAMTASIAHEINQPLTAMVANASAGLRFCQSVHTGNCCGYRWKIGCVRLRQRDGVFIRRCSG